MDLEESFRSLARDIKGVHELDQYDSGDYESLDDIEADMQEEWETYKQNNGLDELGELDGTFVVERKGGILGSERLRVQSADYVINFEEYEPDAEDADDQVFEAEYLCTFEYGGQEGGDVPAFFRSFLDENFERVEEE